MNQVSEAWLRRAHEAKRIALLSHIHPDGDTVGSVLALRLAFLALGKEVHIFCDDDIPKHMRFLEGAAEYRYPEDAEGYFDTAIAVDVSSPDMMGRTISVFNAAGFRMVIDHHATNPAYGQENFIRGGESACCLLAYEAIKALGVEITLPMATCLMLGMSTDTGHFMYPSTSAKTLAAAAELREIGVDISLLTRILYRTQSRERVEMTRIGYQKLRYAVDGMVGVMDFRKEDFEKSGISMEQADGIVNRALEIEGVRMAVLASERENGIKISLRAVEPDTVNDIAKQFGGGGHAQAAGCTIQASIDEALEMIIGAMEKKLRS